MYLLYNIVQHVYNNNTIGTDMRIAACCTYQSINIVNSLCCGFALLHLSCNNEIRSIAHVIKNNLLVPLFCIFMQVLQRLIKVFKPALRSARVHIHSTVR